jgi:phosphatidate cytidylyltransferase
VNESPRKQLSGWSLINPRSWTDLGPRFGSALVLIALVLVSLWLGGYVFAIVVGGVFAGCYREWETMVTLKPLSVPGMALIGAVFLSALVFPAFGAMATLGVVVLAAMAALVLEGDSAGWRAVGLIFFGIVLACTLSVRGTDTDGILAGVFLGVAVWVTDTGAFFVGRQLGGEKLAPDISPGKTRSGAIGGFVVAVVVATIVWHFISPAPLWVGALLAATCSILGQVGDLSESALKRRFRIKDSGDIIPGHGGLMDRLDSLTFAVIFLFLVGLAHSGGQHIAAGILNW